MTLSERRVFVTSDCIQERHVEVSCHLGCDDVLLGE
jgi:hypothetical protein